MKTMERDEGIPLYLWIQDYKSIQNIKSGIRLKRRQTGCQTVIDVMTRFFCIYKVPTSDYNRAIKKALIKFRSGWQYLPTDWQYFDVVNKKGFVGFVEEDYFGHTIRKIKAVRK
jgi:hypothetical protein